jgi:hypothetical protein
MVLGNPGGVEPEALGMSDLLSRQAVAFPGRHGIEQACEEGEATESGERRHRWMQDVTAA